MARRETTESLAGASGPTESGLAPAADARFERRLLLALAGLFVALVALGLHGFSLASWHLLLDGSAAPEVWLGEARTIRWDDYAVNLPLALGQRAHEPPFPLVNTNIGLGQDMLVPFSPPVAHPVTLFRPTAWGFFLGSDAGIAWLWWSQALGLFGIWTLVFRRVLGASVGLALGAGAVLFVSPFFQFWSFNCAAVTAAVGLCVLALHGLLAARSWARSLANGALLGWAGGCALFTLYPPYLVAVSLVTLALLGGWLVDRRRALELRTRWPARAVALALAGGIVATGLALLFHDAGEAIDRMRHTAYPGQRVATGGDRPFWSCAVVNLAAAARVGDSEWGEFGNVCGGTASWFVSPVLALGLLGRWRRTRRRPDALVLALLAVSGLFLAYAHFGVPEAVARVTGLGQMPAQRGLLGSTLAEVVLVVCWLAMRSPPETTSARGARLFHAGVALAWSAVMLASGGFLRAALPVLSWSWIAWMSAANGAVAFLLLERRRPVRTIGLVALALGATTLGFNPLARGGSAYLRENELARTVLDIDAALEGESSWVVYGGSVYANLIASLGVHALNGEQAPPQLDLWRRLDPTPQAREVYNRYAAVYFRWPPARPGMRIGLSNESNFTWFVDPAGPELPALGVTHVLVDRDAGGTFDRYTPVARVGARRIFALPLVEDAVGR